MSARVEKARRETKQLVGGDVDVSYITDEFLRKAETQARTADVEAATLPARTWGSYFTAHDTFFSWYEHCDPQKWKKAKRAHSPGRLNPNCAGDIVKYDIIIDAL